jgi:hypothetical protein
MGKEREMKLEKFIRVILGLALAIGISLSPTALTVSAAACKPEKPTGKTIGTISVGNLDMPIKAFNYPAGGIMEPQGTTLAAGLSLRHMPLDSKLGTTVITWHVNYNGCWSPLNVLMGKEEGFVITLEDEDGVRTKYKIEKKLVVKKGDYKKSWFTLIGPRQIALFTCTGTFTKGHYEKNMVFIATPF